MQYVVSKLRKSKIQCFKRCVIRSWNEGVTAIGSQSLQAEGRILHGCEITLLLQNDFAAILHTFRSPTQASTSSATTGWAGTVGWASYRVCTTCPYNTYAWGHLYCSSYHSCYSTRCTFYIWGLYHHFCHRVSCHGTYIPDIDHFTHCFIPADGRHTCSVRPAYCHPSSDSATFMTSATTSAWHSWTIRAHSSS